MAWVPRGELHTHVLDAEADLSASTKAPGRIVSQEHDYLVAAGARGRSMPDARGHDLADGPQDAVAMEVAEPIVDRS